MNLLDKALQAQQAQQWDEAEKLFTDALLEDSLNDEIYFKFGIFLLQQNNKTAAKEKIGKAIAIAINNQHAEYFIALGHIAKQDKQLKQAQDYFEAALHLEPENPEIHNDLGILCYQQQDFERALQHYIEATHLRPDFAQVHFNLGLLFLQQGKIDFAIKQFRNVISLVPSYIPALRYLGDLFLQQQNYHDAEENYLAIIDAQEFDADVFNNLGVVYLKIQKFEDAAHYFGRALAIDEHHIDARNNLASLYLQHERYDNAMRNYQAVIETNPDDLDANYNLGVAAMAVGELALAEKHFEKALKLKPDYVDAMINLAAVHLKLTQKTKALALYETVLSIDPTHPIALYMLHAQKGDQNPDKAPREYVENLFDNYAGYYDKHMQDVLKYTLPKLIKETLVSILKPAMQVLDLGCGSGLMGELLQAYQIKITGIDLSQKMLKLAEKKQIYQQLIYGDLVTAMQCLDQRYDLIIAADVFVYIGDLNPVFYQVARLLKARGLFCFSTETTEKEYQLLTSARFAHSPEYIQRVAQQYGFELIAQQPIIPRYENEKPIHGVLYSLKNI